MGASASVKYKRLEKKYHVQEKLKYVGEKVHHVVGEAVRYRELSRQQLRLVIAELKLRENEFKRLAHEKIDPILETLQPYYDKYQPIVKKYVDTGVKHSKRIAHKIDDVVTTATLQAIYQTRRQVVSQLSSATMSTYFNIPLKDIVSLKISKRLFTIKNCGPDLRENETEWACIVTDSKFLDKLFKLQWVPWQPTTSGAIKLTESYILDVEYYIRDEFSVKIIHHTRFRVGLKWVALDTSDVSHNVPPRWLQRVDFPEREKRSTLFHDMIAEVYKQLRRDYLFQVERENNSLAASEVVRPPPPKLTVLTPELIKRTLAALAEKIIEEERFIFYTLGEYETWRMGQEDLQYQSDLTIGEMYELFEMEKHDERMREYLIYLKQLEEQVIMALEDVNQGITREEREMDLMHSYDIDIDSDFEED